MEYYVVFQDYGDNGLEAAVDPALTRAEIITRIKTREYDNIVQIDRIVFGASSAQSPELQRFVLDVTRDLIDEAELELTDDRDDVPLLASVVPPVR